MNRSWVCIDSNAVTYLLEAMAAGTCPVGALAAEKISLLRTYLYRDEILHMSPTVEAEYSKIRDEARRKHHVNLGNALLGDTLEPDMQELETRTHEYLQLHRGDQNRNDCQIVAEAELGGCDCLLTYDPALLANLAGRTHGISLLTPKDFWSSLNIPRGSAPVRLPHPTSPLSKETWWIW